MREENYIPAARGIFYDAFGRKKQVSSLRELPRSVCLYSPSPISPETAASRGFIASASCFAAN